MKARLLLDPAVADKPAGAPAIPAAVPTPAAPPAAPTPATKTESASPPVPAAAPEAAKPATPWAEPPKQDADKKESDKAPESKEPEKFDLKVPEGFTMEAAALEKFQSSMKELGLDSKQAQKLLVRDLEAQKASHEETLSYLKSQDAAGAKELQSRWGTKYPENSEKVKRAFDYADPTGKFRKKLADGYLANNPDLIDFVLPFANLIGEDKIAAGTTGVSSGKDNRPLHERTQDAFRKWNKEGK